MSLELLPACRFSLAELAALFTAGYEGYVLPVHVDEEALRVMVEMWDIDLARARVAMRGGVAVGLALIAVRGSEAWVGGVGVVPSERSTGVGRALMEELVAQAPGPVTLEVIEENVPALRLYESLGFEHVRRLEVWSYDGAASAPAVREVEARPLGQSGLPWQRADESVPEECERFEVDGGAILVRVRGPRVNVVQLAARDAEVARALLVAARARGGELHYVNVPEGDPASDALRALGATLDLRQLELRRPTGPTPSR